MANSQTTNAVTATNSITNIKVDNDDEICDNWEQLDYGVLEKRLQTIKLENKDNNEEKNIKNNKNFNTIISSNQQNPQHQPIKILKRPPSNKQLNGVQQTTVNTTPSQPIKTFEQREQEYAQARLRILGSAHPDENNSKIVIAYNSSINQDTQNDDYERSPIKQIPINKLSNNTVYLIREPICPDGTKGFNSKQTQDLSIKDTHSN